MAGVRLYGEMHRFVPVLAFARGYKVGELVIRHRARKFGRILNLTGSTEPWSRVGPQGCIVGPSPALSDPWPMHSPGKV